MSSAIKIFMNYAHKIYMYIKMIFNIFNIIIDVNCVTADPQLGMNYLISLSFLNILIFIYIDLIGTKI